MNNKNIFFLIFFLCAASGFAQTENGWLEVKEAPGVTDKELLGSVPIQGASFVFKEKPASFDKPILLKGGVTWIPLRETSQKLSLSFISRSEEAFIIIRNDGLPLEFTANEKEIVVNRKPFLSLEEPIRRFEGEPYAALPDMVAIFEENFKWDAEGKILNVAERARVEGFTVFTKPKPPEPIEERIEPPKPPISPASVPFTEKRLIPEPLGVRPDVKLHITNSATYFQDNLPKKSMSRTYSVRTGGLVYDYKLDSYFRFQESNHKNGIFTTSSKYIGLYGDDFWFRSLDLNTNLYPLRSQGEGYEGFSFTTLHEPWSVEYYGGKKEITVPGPANVGSVKFFGRLGGIKGKTDLGLLDLGGDVLYMINDPETLEKAGATDYPRRNLVLKGDAGLDLPFGARVESQYALCNFNPDNLKDERIQDYDWRLKAAIEKKRWSAGYVYEFIGTDYASLSFPQNYRDYKGYNTYFTFRPLDYFSVNIAHVANQNNVDDVDSQATAENKFLSAGSDMRLPDGSSVGFSWDSSYNKTTGPGFTYVEALGSTSANYKFTYSKSYGQDWSVFGSYTRSMTDYFGSDNDSWSDTYMASVYKFFPRFKGSHIRLRYQTRKSWYMASGRFTTITGNTSLGIRFYPVRQLLLYSDWDLNTTEAENIRDRAMLGTRSGATLTLTKDVQFGIDYTFNQTDVNHFSRKAWNNWSVLFRGTMGFDVGTPAKWSKVKGFVFVDENENGLYDPKEPGVGGAIVKIPKEVMAMTGKNGSYNIKHVIPGIKKLELEETSVPFGLVSLEEAKHEFVGKEYGKKRIDFPLVKVGTMSGRLYIDKNENGISDELDPGLDNVSVYLNDTYKWTVTDEDGNFSFEFLAPGKYKLTVNEEDIPAAYDTSGIEDIEVELKQGQDMKDVYLRLREKKIIKKVF